MRRQCHGRGSVQHHVSARETPAGRLHQFGTMHTHTGTDACCVGAICRLRTIDCLASVTWGCDVREEAQAPIAPNTSAMRRLLGAPSVSSCLGRAARHGAAVWSGADHKVRLSMVRSRSLHLRRFPRLLRPLCIRTAVRLLLVWMVCQSKNGACV